MASVLQHNQGEVRKQVSAEEWQVRQDLACL